MNLQTKSEKQQYKVNRNKPKFPPSPMDPFEYEKARMNYDVDLFKVFTQTQKYFVKDAENALPSCKIREVRNTGIFSALINSKEMSDS